MQRVINEGRLALLGLGTPGSTSMSLERTLCNLRDEFSPALSAPQFEALRKSIVLFGEAIGAASPSLEGERAATNVESV